MQILENYRHSCNSINLQGAEDSRRNRFKKIYPETPQNYSFHYLVDASSCDTTRMMSLSLSISRNISKLLVSTKQKTQKRSKPGEHGKTYGCTCNIPEEVSPITIQYNCYNRPFSCSLHNANTRVQFVDTI